MRNGKGELIEENDLDLLEDRGVDLRKKCFQIGINAPKSQPAEVRKRDMCSDWHVQQLPHNIAAWDGGVKGDPERL